MTPTLPVQHTVRRKTLFTVLTILLLYLFFEVLSLAALAALGRFLNIRYTPIAAHYLSRTHKEGIRVILENRSPHLTYSNLLGWTLKPNGATAVAEINSQGVRSNHEFAMSPANGTIRIAAFGDSFTYAEGVKNKNTWEEQLTQIDPSIETMNFGVPGYGLDQAFLRYKSEGGSFHPHIVLLGYFVENILRHINVFRPFYSTETGTPLTKPRFVLRGDELVLVNNPLTPLSAYQKLLSDPETVLPRLGEYDYHYQTKYRADDFDFIPSVRLFKMASYNIRKHVSPDPVFIGRRYNPKSEAFLVTAKLFDAFYAAALKNGSLPVIVIFPKESNVRDVQTRRFKLHAPLMDYFEKRGYRVIDLTDGFARYAEKGKPVEDLYDGHFSEEGNRVAAEAVYQYLRKNGLLSEKTTR